MNWTLFPARELIKLRDRWQEINVSGSASPLLWPEFVIPLLDHFGDGREMLAVAGEAAAPEAMAILRRTGAGRWQTFQPSQMPVGTWVHRPGTPIEPLLASLTRRLPGFACMIGVTQQDPDILTRPSNGSSLRTLDYIKTARITIDRPFDQYWEARGKNLKHNMKKQRSRLEKEGIKTSLEIIGEPGGIARAIADYGVLETAGWKSEGGTAISPDNSQGRFYRAMLEEFCRRHSGRVYCYRFNDRVVAVDLCIEGNGTLIILKTSYVESIKTCSPAFLMRQDAVQRLYAEGRIKRIEFYGKLMEWHSRWTDEVRTMYHINYYRWSALRTAHWAISRGRPGPLIAAGEIG